MQQLPTAQSDCHTTVRLTHYTTDIASAILGVRAQTMRASLCRDGHYFGVRPVKRPNRYLGWPADEIDALARGEVAAFTAPAPREPRPTSAAGVGGVE